MKVKHLLIVLLCGMWIPRIEAQSDIEALKESNVWVYEGNKKVDKDFVQAEKAYRRAISEYDKNATGSYNLGNAYYESGLYDEAMLRHLEAAKNAGTKLERHRAFHNIGNTLMLQQQCQEAVEAYKNALRNDPTDEETRYNLALAKDCAEKQGEGDSGEKDQKEDEKEDQNQEEEQQEQDQQDGDQENDDQNEGNENEDQNQGDQDDDQGKPKQDQGQNDENDPNNQKRQQKPGKLSPEQVKSLLEAMNNEEKKVQEKINAKKAKGVKVKREKDW